MDISLVKDIISPLLGIVLQDNFAALTLTIGKAKLGYGAFIMAIVNFVIMAFILFTIIKVMNSFKKQPEAVEEAPTTKVCPHCMSEINIEAHRCPHCTSELAD